jgi:hypothetical protein
VVLIGFASLAAGDVGVTVWAGAGGNVRQGATIPVVVELRNDGRDRSGIVMAGFSQGNEPRTWAMQALSLPPNARKRVSLYLPLNSYMMDSVVVRYETASGARHVAFEERIQPVPATTPMLAVVGEPPAGLPPTKMGNAERYRSVILQPSLLPVRREGLEMYDVLLLSPAPSLPFEREQVAAIEDWVLRGGTLVVDASRRTDGLRQADLRALLPFLPDTTEQAELPEFGKLDYAKGTVRDGAALLAAGDVPLIVRRNYGLGSVVCFAFDPSQPAFVAHPRQEALWRDVLGPLKLTDRPSEEFQFDFGAGTIDTVMRRVANTGGTPMRLLVVVLLTALYALIVGPGDYFLAVKWLRKPRLTWITFPLTAIAFSVLAYGGARIWFGGETVSRGFHHLTVFPELGKSVAFDAAGLFAGQSGEYTLQHVDGALWRPVQGQFDPEQNLFINAEEELVRQRIPVWSHRVYVAGETTPAAADIRLTAGSSSVAVVNHSAYTLTGCTVYRDTRQGACPSIAPGQTVTVELGEEAPAPPHSEQDHEAATVTPDVVPVRVGLADQLPPASDPDGQTKATDVFLGKVEPGFGKPSHMDAPFARELFGGDALRRGATVLQATASESPQSPLLVNGERRGESTAFELAVVMYGSASE